MFDGKCEAITGNEEYRTKHATRLYEHIKSLSLTRVYSRTEQCFWRAKCEYSGCQGLG
jgi:hypothetical protein